ncbi:hypothetical protein [Streptomyces sp. ALI-76-A]|uniref:hypothetical protein n=1 Tax=Streptomyces sp. ALI-76-A TaxID=3025736 RepID=UPI00256F08B9|nr:hypothetical protein [Streptomyces sp. ALI-76-A]MDL5199641.1 hypothetical protein [Streptomyces sp. ALI-76-A]
MSTSTISTNDLANLQVGDKVVVKPGWGGREEETLVRLGSDSWYDLVTGLQDGSGATRIERVA